MIQSKNPIVRNALNAAGEAVCNFADGDKIVVRTETETLFGRKPEKKVMTVKEIRDAMVRLGHGRLFTDVMRDVEAGREANPLITVPCEAWFQRA